MQSPLGPPLLSVLLSISHSLPLSSEQTKKTLTRKLGAIPTIFRPCQVPLPPFLCSIADEFHLGNVAKMASLIPYLVPILDFAILQSYICPSLFEHEVEWWCQIIGIELSSTTIGLAWEKVFKAPFLPGMNSGLYQMFKGLWKYWLHRLCSWNEKESK